jgi:phenylalanyl-tRNA synthetase beta chain
MLIGSLLGVLKTNLNLGNSPCRIFEIADTFVPTADVSLPIEKTRLALVCDSDFRDLRGVVEGLITNIGRDAQVVFVPAEQKWAQTAAEIVVNGDRIGVAGIISNRLRDKFDFENVIPCAAELEFEALLALQSKELKVKPIPRFPAIVRDLSLIVDEQVRWADIVEAVNRKASAELEQTCFVGIYRGEVIPAGKKSVTLSLKFRDQDGTLTHESVDRLEADIVAELARTVGAELRTA